MMKKSAVAVAIALGFTGVANADINFSGAANFGLDKAQGADTERTATLSMKADFTNQISEELTFDAGVGFGDARLLSKTVDGDQPENGGAVEFNLNASLTHTTYGKAVVGETGDVFGGVVFTKYSDWNPGAGAVRARDYKADGEGDERTLYGVSYEGTFGDITVKAGHWDSDYHNNNLNSGFNANVSAKVIEGLTVAGSVAQFGSNAEIVEDATKDAEVEGVAAGEAGTNYAFGAKYENLIPGLNLNAGAGFADGSDAKFGFGTDYKIMEGIVAYAAVQVQDTNSYKVGADAAVPGITGLNVAGFAEILDDHNDFEVSGNYTFAEIAGIAPKLEAKYHNDGAAANEDKIDLKASASIFGVSTYAQYATDANEDRDGEDVKIGASYSISF